MGKKVIKALKRKDDAISHACVDFLCALMQPMHDNFDIRQEQMNKRSLLSSTSFLDLLLQPLKYHVVCHVTHLLCKITRGVCVISTALKKYLHIATCMHVYLDVHFHTQYHRTFMSPNGRVCRTLQLLILLM